MSKKELNDKTDKGHISYFLKAVKNVFVVKTLYIHTTDVENKTIPGILVIHKRLFKNKTINYKAYVCKNAVVPSCCFIV